MAEDKIFYTKKLINLRGNPVDLSTPVVMGILNVTPDSFYDGGRLKDEKSILNKVDQMLFEGAFLIDVGGYSSRPGAEDIPVDEELGRVIPVIKSLLSHFPDINISIDTFRAEVARQAVAEGACMINDISGGDLDEGMLPLVAELKLPYVMMHMRGTPRTMTTLTDYEDVVNEIVLNFSEKLKKTNEMGIADVIVDPGFGFAKSVDQNYGILEKLKYFNVLDRPLLVGLSRKSMIFKTLGISPEEALNGTTVLNTVALMNGADILRVHDVKEAVQAVHLVKKMYD